VELSENGEKWTVQRDLLNSNRFTRDFVVEMDDSGYAKLRFDKMRRPPAGSLKAIYRTGNGSAGNIGAEAIVHVVTEEMSIIGLRNPLPAQGGIDTEPIEQVRLFAPQAFQTQKRAVTETDYTEIIQQYPEVQKAVATLRWTGSWYTMFINVDRRGGRQVDDEFKNKLYTLLEPFRMAGYDIEIKGSQYVPLDIAMTVCVAPGYSRSDVKIALLEAFSRWDLPDGRRGFFHPDNFTFGQTVYLSRIITTAMKVQGVQWVDMDDRYQEGQISMGRLEIARLDNDLNRPENGRIEFYMEGAL
jgi:predicted phage baseplate assembly protein